MPLTNFKIALSSIIYRLTRKLAVAIATSYRHQKGLGPDLESVILWGDNLIHKLPKSLKKWAFTYKIPQNKGVYLHNLYFPSPIVVAAFKDDFDLIDTWLMLGVGGITLKTLMSEKRDGNPRPRIQHITVDGQPAIINAMGLPSKGLAPTLIALNHSPALQLRSPNRHQYRWP